MRIGLLDINKITLSICTKLQNSEHEFVGLYINSLKHKDECWQLGIYLYAYKDLSGFLDGLDWLIISIDKNWHDIIPNVLRYINKDTELTFISSTSVYGNRNGDFVNEDTNLDTSLVREHIRELISAEGLIQSRNKSYTLRCGLLYENKDDLISKLIDLSPTEIYKYINITHMQLLLKHLDRNVYSYDLLNKKKIKNVVTQAIRLDDLLNELDIEVQGTINMYNNIRVENNNNL